MALQLTAILGFTALSYESWPSLSNAAVLQAVEQSARLPSAACAAFTALGYYFIISTIHVFGVRTIYNDICVPSLQDRMLARRLSLDSIYNLVEAIDLHRYYSLVTSSCSGKVGNGSGAPPE